MDLSKQLPNLDVSKFDSLIQVLEHNISTFDLFIKPVSDLSKNLNRSSTEINEFISLLTNTNSNVIDSIGLNDLTPVPIVKRQYINTGMDQVNEALGGGVVIGEITEIFGSSGCGKSQLLYQLSIQSQLNDRNRIIFITTESFLETRRLNEIISNTKSNKKIGLENIDYIYCQDLEIQHETIFNKLAFKLRDQSIQTVIIDSIGHHLRRESTTNVRFLKKIVRDLEMEIDKDNLTFQRIKSKHYQQFNNIYKLAGETDLNINKKYYILKLYQFLNKLCKTFNISIIVSNQVSDQLTNYDPLEYLPSNNALDLDYQIGNIIGWDNYTLKNYQNLHNGNNINNIANGKLSQSSSNTNKVNIIHESESNKRQNTSTSFEDPRYKNSEPSYITTHVPNLNNVNNVKHHVPSLGYHWLKLIPNKIMLTKNYKPNLKRDFNDDVTGWHVQRFLKVINSDKKIEYEIVTGGLIEK